MRTCNACHGTYAGIGALMRHRWEAHPKSMKPRQTKTAELQAKGAVTEQTDAKGIKTPQPEWAIRLEARIAAIASRASMAQEPPAHHNPTTCVDCAQVITTERKIATAQALKTGRSEGRVQGTAETNERIAFALHWGGNVDLITFYNQTIEAWHAAGSPDPRTETPWLEANG